MPTLDWIGKDIVINHQNVPYRVKADGGHRKFILIEMMDDAEMITAERVRRVIHGYGSGKNNLGGTTNVS